MDDLLPFNEAHYVAEPYAYWARLRDEAPVYWSERNRFWAVTRHDDVLAVLHDPARFSSRGGPSGASEEFGIPTDARDRLRLWNASTSVTGASDLKGVDPPNVMKEMHATLAKLIEARRANPREGRGAHVG